MLVLHSGSVICSHGSHNLGNCTQPSQPSPAQPSPALVSTLRTGSLWQLTHCTGPLAPAWGSHVIFTRPAHTLALCSPDTANCPPWPASCDTPEPAPGHTTDKGGSFEYKYTEKSPHKHTKTDTADKLKLQMLAGGIKIPSCPRLFCHTFKRYFSEISIDPVFVNNQNCYKRNSARSKQRSAEAEQRGGEHSI